jgi:hypothetical protein
MSEPRKTRARSVREAGARRGIFVDVKESLLRQNGTPSWLNGFAPTGHKLATDDLIMADTGACYLVFVRKASAGRIALGPPSMDIDNAMYFAFFAEAK